MYNGFVKWGTRTCVISPSWLVRDWLRMIATATATPANDFSVTLDGHWVDIDATFESARCRPDSRIRCPKRSWAGQIS